MNNQDGLIEFNTMRFYSEGVYTYYLQEQGGNDDQILYDASVYKITVSVEEQDDAYTAAVTCEKDGDVYSVLPRFTNKTKSSESASSEHPTEQTQPDTPDNPKTGDDSNITLFSSLLLASLAAVLLLAFFMKRKKGGNKNE